MECKVNKIDTYVQNYWIHRCLDKIPGSQHLFSQEIDQRNVPSAGIFLWNRQSTCSSVNKRTMHENAVHQCPAPPESTASTASLQRVTAPLTSHKEPSAISLTNNTTLKRQTNTSPFSLDQGFVVQEMGREAQSRGMSISTATVEKVTT